MSLDKHIREHKKLGIGASRAEITANVSMDVGSITSEHSGFVNNPDGSIGNHTTISFDEGTRTFTITPVSSSFNYWIKGRKYQQTGAASIVISDVDGGHFIYFEDADNDGVAQLVDDESPPTANLLNGVAYICYIQWNVTQQKAVLVAEERHGLTMDYATHDRLHFAQGAVYLREKGGLGITVNSVDGTGAIDNDTQIAIENGAFKDEDIQNNVTDGSPQDISPILSSPVIYRTGASGLWNIDASTNFPMKSFVGGSGRIAYNQWTGATWQQAEVSNNGYTLSHIFATNDIRHPIVTIQGISEYTNVNAARQGASTELTQLSGVPFVEFIPIGTIIIQTSTSFVNTKKARIVSTESGASYVDFRSFGGVTVSGAPADYPQYALATTPGQTVAGSTGEITGEPTGFLNRTDSTLSFVNGTRTFTIAPAVTEYVFYNDGIKFTKNLSESIVISNTEGMHYIYFNNVGVLQETTVDDHSLLFSNAYVAAIYWDATNSQQIFFADERHGTVQDYESHKQAHEKQGTYLEEVDSNLVLGNITAEGDGLSDTHAQLSVSDGIIWDEDLSTTITDGAPQELSTIAQIPVFYKTGASGAWRKDTATNFPVKNFVGGSGLLAYNQFTGGAWQQTEVSNAQFALMHIWATNDINNPVIAIQGQGDYLSIITARAGAKLEIKNLILTGLPVTEFVPLGSVIFQTSTGYTNTVKARIRLTDSGANYVDWRFLGGSRLLTFMEIG